MELIETTVFTRQILGLLPAEEYRVFQLQLAANPELGAVIPGTGGLRKVRVAASGRGKRGGARVIYYWVPRRDLILLLFVYPKNEAPDLTAEQRKKLRRIVEEEFSDENRTI